MASAASPFCSSSSTTSSGRTRIPATRFFDFFSAVRESSYIGVNLFFALSGFLITGILLDTLHIPHFFKTFYARRALRIFPLYYGVLLMLLLFTRPLHLAWHGWQYLFLTYTANLVWWARPPLDMTHININHFWSLQVEEQFYLIWPFIVFRVRKLQSLITLSLITCVAILLIRIGLVAARSHLENPYLFYSATFSCADNLLFGCCLCALLRTSLRARVLRLAPRMLAVCTVVLLLASFFNDGLRWQTSVFIPTLGFTLLGIASACLIAMTLRGGSRSQRFFRNRVLRFFGKYSYGLYIFHYSLDRSLTGPIRAFLDPRFHSKAVGILGGAIIVTLVSILGALLSYHLYEVPFLRLKKYFSYSKPAAQPEHQIAHASN